MPSDAMPVELPSSHSDMGHSSTRLMRPVPSTARCRARSWAAGSPRLWSASGTSSSA